MPKVSIYLPDELYERARANDLPLSSLTQRAVEEALRALTVDQWIAQVKDRPTRATRASVSTSALLDEVRGEFGA